MATSQTEVPDKLGDLGGEMAHADADSPLDVTRAWTLAEVAAWWQLREPEEVVELGADNLQLHVREVSVASPR